MNTLKDLVRTALEDAAHDTGQPLGETELSYMADRVVARILLEESNATVNASFWRGLDQMGHAK